MDPDDTEANLQLTMRLYGEGTAKWGLANAKLQYERKRQREAAGRELDLLLAADLGRRLDRLEALSRRRWRC